MGEPERLLTHHSTLERCKVKADDIKRVLERLRALDPETAKQLLVPQWVEQLEEACEEHARTWREHLPHVWLNAELLGLMRRERSKLKRCVERVRYVWFQERPGLLR